MGSKGQNLTFSEHGHVAYQIKENDECSNMQSHILFLHTTLTPGMGSKVKPFFLKVVKLYSKREWNVEHHASTYSILTHTVKCSNYFFLNIVMLHIKLKGMEHRAPCKHIFCPYTHYRLLGWDQKSKYVFLK